MSKFSPSSNKAHDLGASDKKWGTLHVGTVSAEDATVSGDLTISGNLTVLGEATEVSLTELTVADPLIKVADGNNANAVDIGFYGQYNEGGGARYSGLAKDATDGKFKLFDNLAVEPTTTFDGSSSGHLKASTFEGSLVGNADSATVLDTARDFSISGDVTASAVSFDGSSSVELVVSIDEGAVTNAMLAGSIADGKLAQDYIQTSEVDDSSIEFAGGTLNVKALGVTNAMLAGSIANDKLSNSSVSFGGVSVSLGGSDASPAFNLADATGYPAASLTGTVGDAQLTQDYVQTSEVDGSSIEWSGTQLQVKALGVTNAMLAGSIANDKLSNSSVSFGGVTLSLGGSDASPAFNLADATGYPAASLTGTVADAQLTEDYIKTSEVDDSSIEFAGGSLNVKALGVTNDMLAGGIANAKLSNSSVSFGGVSLSLGQSDASPAFDLADAYNYPAASLTGTVGDAQLTQDYIQTSEVDGSSIEFAGGSLNVKALGITNAMLAGSIANDKLSNSTVSFGGVSLSLGGSDASPAFNLADATGYPTSSLVGQILDGQIAQDYIQITEVDDSSIEFAGGTLNVKALGITNAMLAGSIANDKLSNSSVSFGGVTLSLGQSDASPAFDLSDATGYPTSSLVGQILDGQIAQDYIQITEVDDSSIEWSGSAIRVKDLGITNAKLAGSIANAKLVNSSITVGDGTNSEAIALGESFSIQGTAQEVEVAYSTALNKFTVGLPNSVSVTSNLDVGGNITASGALIVGGNLTASGQITSTGANISFADNLIELGVNNTDLEDIGFYGQIGDGAGGSNGFAGVAYDISKDKFVMFKDATEPTTTISGGATYADIEVGGVTASSGNFSGSLAGKLQIQSVTAPVTASSAGTAGQIAYDSNYFYVCIATNSWKRVAINDGW